MTPVQLEPLDLLLAAVLVVAAGGVSLGLQLGLGKRLAWAAARMVVQLLAVGLVLEWVFRRAAGGWVLLLLLSMLVNAAGAAVQRSEQRFPGVWSTALIAVSVSAVVATFPVTTLVLNVEPWYAPRYVIPLLGMVLGNTLTGIALVLDRTSADLRDRRAEVEARLSLGASAWEATRPILTGAIRSGMVPILNSMSVAGIVSLPGMMTGQILAGVRPVDAVQYQIMIMFMIAGGTSIGALLAGLLAFRKLTTRDHQLTPVVFPEH